MFVAALVVLFGFFALAIDLASVIHRKMELQNAADIVALSAAHELNGTADGITHAVQNASSRFTSAAGGLTYAYGTRTMTWSDRAISFARSPSGPWRSYGDALANADGLLYVQVNTAGLDDEYGAVATVFLQTFNNTAAAQASGRAVAGRSAIKVTPLGICAMRDESHRNHNGELEERGFRRGVGYNLLDLNRPGSTTGQTFIVNPIAQSAPVTDVATLAPFVCTGTMAMTRLTGGKVKVSPAFPIASLFEQFNSRFNTYGTGQNACDRRTAPADVNIKEYTFNGGSLWMGTTPAQQSAVLLATPERRWTVAGPDTAPAGAMPAQFGPLWSYARAVPYAAYIGMGLPEPVGGYPTYDVGAWNTLYAPGQSTSSTTPYPTSSTTPTPYSHLSVAAFYSGPPGTNKSLANRRVLNLPLLACPVAGSEAEVVGIGRFFMTVPARIDRLYGEFAGLVPEQSLGTRIVLYP